MTRKSRAVLVRILRVGPLNKMTVEYLLVGLLIWETAACEAKPHVAEEIHLPPRLLPSPSLVVTPMTWDDYFGIEEEEAPWSSPGSDPTAP